MAIERRGGRTLTVVPLPVNKTAPAVKEEAQPTRAGGVRNLTITDSEREGLAKEFRDMIIKAGETSRVLPDPFEGSYGTLALPSGNAKKKNVPAIIEPYFPIDKLQSLFLVSQMLRTCIEAYATNIDGFGHTYEYIGEEGDELSDESLMQKEIAAILSDSPTYNMSMKELRKKLRIDKHTYGNAYLEIMRNKNAEITELRHLSGQTTRLTQVDPEPVDVIKTLRLPSGRKIKRTYRMYFRRFVQKMSSGGKPVYFKEFGDPRTINCETGEVATDTLDKKLHATEVKHFFNYTPGMSYGTPLWITCILDILGIREAAMVNLNFFRENAIPAMAVLVSGGYLTEESFRTVSASLRAAKGKDAAHKLVVLEATGEDSGASDKPNPAPRIEFKSMMQDRQSDASFSDYTLKAKNTIRSSMRLPALFSGDTQEFTKATAFTSILIAENQVFAPERSDFDTWYNTEILSTYGVDRWRFKSLGPKVTDAEDVAVLLSALDETGALTPNVGIKLANELLGLTIEKVFEDWGDYPFEVVRDIVRQGFAPHGLEDVIGEQFNKQQVAGGGTPPQDSGGDPKTTSTVKRKVRIGKRIMRREA